MQCTMGLWSCILANAVKQSFVVSLLNFAGRCYCERFRSTQLFILTQHCNCNCADKCCCKNCFLQPWSSRELQRRSAVKFCWLRKNELLVLHWVCSPLLMKFTLSSWTRRWAGGWTRSWTRRWTSRWTGSWTRRWWVEVGATLTGTQVTGGCCVSLWMFEGISPKAATSVTKGWRRNKSKLKLNSIIMFSLHHVAINRLFGDFS